MQQPPDDGHPLTFTPLHGWPPPPEVQDEWSGLVRCAGPWLPFQEPAWAAAWWRHLRRDDASRRDRFVLWVGRGASGGVRAIAPVVVSERPGRGPLRLRVARTLGPDPNVTELQPVLCHPADAAAACEGLFLELERRRDEWDAFGWMSVPSRAAASLRRCARVEHVLDVPNYVLHPGPQWDEWKAALPRNVKEAIRKSRNAPKRAGIDLRFEAVEAGGDVTRILPELFRLHAARAAAPGLLPHADVFAQPPARAFLTDLVGHWAAQGRTVLLTLRHAERVVACRLAFVSGASVYLYFSGFDPAYANYSVMTRTLAEGLEWACARGVQSVNLSTGTDVSKTRWRPTCLGYVRLWQWAETTRGRLARVVQGFAERRRRAG